MERYCLITAAINEFGIDQNSVTHVTSTSVAQSPKIKLPTFGGNIFFILHLCLSWDVFTSLVYYNINLEDVETFRYFLLPVSVSATSIVRSVPLSNANYNKIWETLHERFDNKRVFLNAYFDATLHFKSIHKKTFSDSLWF